MSEKARVRRARVWALVDNHTKGAAMAFKLRDSAERTAKHGGYFQVVRATLTWTEPAPKRKPRHGR